MKKLALIVNNVVKNIIITELITNYPEYTDVTGLTCNKGWTDNQDGTFSPPAPEPSIRIIRRKAFFRRLSTNERKILRESTDDAVIDVREFLMMENFVNLDDSDLAADLATAGMNQTRIDALLVDGTFEESYRGNYE